MKTFLTEIDNYDGNDYDGVDDPQSGDIYGAINEQNEFQTIKNPYYGGDLDDGPTTIKVVQNPYYDGDI